MSNRTGMACSVCYGTGRDVAGKRCPFDCAPTSEPAVDLDAERAAFEAWSSEAAPGHSIDRCRDSYESYPVASAWHAWQARAKIATPSVPAVPETAPMVSERSFCERCGKRLSLDSIHTCTPPADLAPQVAQASPDSERLDWLDQINAATNARNKTVYGWKFDINHNRASLTDHNFPALSIRQAIDSARATGTDTSQGEA